MPKLADGKLILFQFFIVGLPQLHIFILQLLPHSIPDIQAQPDTAQAGNNTGDAGRISCPCIFNPGCGDYRNAPDKSRRANHIREQPYLSRHQSRHSGQLFLESIINSRPEQNAQHIAYPCQKPVKKISAGRKTEINQTCQIRSDKIHGNHDRE